MVRRAGIAQSLLSSSVVILDEPTSGLDPQERTRFKNMISRMRGTDTLFLLSTHIVEDIESLCDIVLVMHEGQVLFAGSPKALAEKASGLVYLVPHGAIPSITGAYYEAQTAEADSRILFPHPQVFQTVAPTLEDRYMAIMKGFAC